MNLDIGANMASRRAWRWSVAGMVVACLCFFFPLVIHPFDLLVGPQNEGSNDLSTSFLAFRGFPGVAFANGQLPFWNPHTLGGAPWLGNPQSALFYPPNWLCLALPVSVACSWLLVLHHLWGGFGVILLCRCYGLRAMAACLGGVIFAGAPFLIAQTGEGHFNQICLIAWVPWSFLAFERLRNGRQGGVAAMSSVLAICFFCGHVQELFYLVVVLTGAIGLEVIRRITRGRPRDAAKLCFLWIVAGIVTAGLVAFEFEPIWIYMRQAVRGSGMTVAEGGQISLGFENLWQLFSPDALGGPAQYRGPGRFYWETLCYFGTVPLVLAGCGICLGYRRSWVVGLTLLGLISLCFAFGSDLPVFPAFHRFVPGMKLFRAPSRSLFFTSFAVAMLAAAGSDGLASLWQTAGGKRRLQIGGTVLLLVAALLAITGIAINRGLITIDALSEPALLALHATTTWWSLTLAITSIGLACLRPRLGQFAILGLLGLCTFELTLHARMAFRTIAPADLREDSVLVQFLKREKENHRVLASQTLLSDREASQAGLFKIQGYDPVPLVSTALAIDALVPDVDTATAVVGFGNLSPLDLRLEIADLIGIRYVVTEHVLPEDPPGWKLEAIGEMPVQFQLRHDEPKPPQRFAVYENMSVLPRAYVVGAAHLSSAGKNQPETLCEMDPKTRVLLDRDVLPEGERSSFQPVRMTEYTPNRVVTEVSLDAPGYLVLSDTWYPGWKARLGDQELPVLRANLSFRAVPLLAGTHRVVWEYTPPGLFLGGLLTLLTLVGVAATTLRPHLKESGAAAPEDVVPPTDEPLTRPPVA